MNPSLIDARGYVTEDYLVSMSSSLTSPQQPQQPPVLPQVVQQPQVVQEAPNGSSTTVINMAPALEPQPRKMVNSATAPEISSSAAAKSNKHKLPAIKTSSTAQNLSLTTTNIKAHNRGHVDEKLDLDQTTMIGSALDLDSLESANEDEDVVKDQTTATGSSHAGSQVGLLKLSAV